MPLSFRELSSAADVAAAYPLMRQLRDRVREETFASEVRRQQEQGYRLAVMAKADGIERIDPDSRSTAKGFYEKLGFRFHTSIPCWIGVEELLGGG